MERGGDREKGGQAEEKRREKQSMTGGKMEKSGSERKCSSTGVLC